MAAGSDLFYVIANAISKPVLQRGKAHQSLWYDEAFRCDLIVVQIHVVFANTDSNYLTNANAYVQNVHNDAKHANNYTSVQFNEAHLGIHHFFLIIFLNFHCF